MFQTEMKFEIIWKPEIGGVQLQLWVSLVPNVGCHFSAIQKFGGSYDHEVRIWSLVLLEM